MEEAKQAKRLFGLFRSSLLSDKMIFGSTAHDISKRAIFEYGNVCVYALHTINHAIFSTNQFSHAKSSHWSNIRTPIRIDGIQCSSNQPS